MGDTVSRKKRDANRRNARRSTGPKTPRGKEAVRFNALKHGLLAKTVVLSTGWAKESLAEFTEFLSCLREELKPEGIYEEMLVERAAVACWRKRRALRSEASEIADAVADSIGQTMANVVDELQDSDPAEWGAREREAARASRHGLARLIEIVKDVRQQISRNGTLGEEGEAQLMQGWGDAPEGLASQCREITIRVEEAEEAKDPERAEQELQRLQDLLGEELARLTAALQQMKTAAAQAWAEEALARWSVPSVEVVDRILRYERAHDREFAWAMAELQRRRGERS